MSICPGPNLLQTSNLEGVINTLQAVYKVCQEKRRLCQKIEEDYRKLFKPWPKKKIQSINTCGANEPDKKGTSVQLEIKDSKLPTKEELDLTLVEKALAKAEKTRSHFQNKVAKCKSNSTDDLTRAAVGDSKSVPSNADRKLSAQEIPLSGEHRPVSGRRKLSVGNTISLRHLNNIQQPKPSRLNIAHRAGVTGQVNCTGKAPATGQGSAKRRYSPAHVSAPFKTDVERRGRGSIIKVKPAISSRPNSGILAKKTEAPLSIPARNSSDVSISLKHAEKENTVNVQNVQQVTEILPKLDDLSLNETTTDVEKGTSEEPKDERFSLLKDGKQLKMPEKFNKLMTQNRRLRHKIHQGSIKSKTPLTPCCADVFMHSLLSSIHEDKSEIALRMRKVLSMTGLYCHLHQLLLQVQQTVSTTGEMQCQDVLSCKMKLELVLNAFASLEENYRQLLSEAPDSSTSDDSVSLVQQLPSSAFYWLPQDIGTVPRPTGCLMYTSRKQLLIYTTLLHEAQVLMMEKHILQQMEEIIPRLGQATGEESWFVPVYRGLYGMVCSLGLVFPTVVTDTINNLEDDCHIWDNDF